MRALMLLLTILLLPLSAWADGQWVGTPAPSTRLQDQGGQWRSLDEFRGQWLALYFYPKNGTPGCTEEALQFSKLYPQLQKEKIAVVGVSVDDVASHQEFAAKLKLPFPLLADEQQTLARHFKVLRGFGPVAFARRETFLIDPQGVIVYHYPSVNTQQHAAQILADVKRLSQKP